MGLLPYHKLMFSLFIFQVWRVGFMGHNSYPENVDLFLRLFKEAIESVHAGRPKSQL